MVENGNSAGPTLMPIVMLAQEIAAIMLMI
jgi:hypothetical protein